LIASTKNPDTLSEVKRKQNERESLTNISDFTFEFFKTLELFCRGRLTYNIRITGHYYVIQNFRNIIIIPSYLT
jgi:hypothetical protein